MPRLRIRRVGMSHLIEGFEGPGASPDQLLEELTLAFGPAVAPMGSEEGPEIEGVIVDAKAASAEALYEWVAAWARRAGWSRTVWSGASPFVLDYQRGPSSSDS